MCAVISRSHTDSLLCILAAARSKTDDFQVARAAETQADLSRCADNHRHDSTYFSLQSQGANHHICRGLFCETVCIFFSLSLFIYLPLFLTQHCRNRRFWLDAAQPAAKKAALWIKPPKARWWRRVNTLDLYIYLFNFFCRLQEQNCRVIPHSVSPATASIYISNESQP